jgi:broad specificity phosphatase PhoE
MYVTTHRFLLFTNKIDTTKQAKALGDSFAEINITAIHASPLQRAHSTAKAIHDAHHLTKAGNPIEFHDDPDLREQYFGIAEGHPWARPGTEASETDIQRKVYPAKTGRDDRFLDGESLNELNQRAGRAIDRIVIPAILKAKGEKVQGVDGVDGTHLVIVSHGLCISELLANLVGRTGETVRSGKFAGLENTAWTRVQVGLQVCDNVFFP